MTAEKGLPRIKVYRTDGTLESVVAGPDEFHEATVSLDLAVAPNGRVIVADVLRGLLRVFERRPAPTPAGSDGGSP